MNGELVLFKAAFFYMLPSCYHRRWVVDTPNCIGVVSRIKEMHSYFQMKGSRKEKNHNLQSRKFYSWV